MDLFDTIPFLTLFLPGSVGLDLRSMIHRYKKGQEYKCQIKWAHVNVSIGKVNPNVDIFFVTFKLLNLQGSPWAILEMWET